jgi:uncharacterized protein with HEPN domain
MSEIEPVDGLERNWCMYLDDMIAFAEKALLYSDGLTRDQFEVSGLNYDATVRNLELIGEAATHIPGLVREFAPHIQWRQIIATRNRLIHGYLGIDNDTLWSILQADIPRLLMDLNALKASADDNLIQ